MAIIFVCLSFLICLIGITSDTEAYLNPSFLQEIRKKNYEWSGDITEERCIGTALHAALSSSAIKSTGVISALIPMMRHSK